MKCRRKTGSATKFSRLLLSVISMSVFSRASHQRLVAQLFEQHRVVVAQESAQREVALLDVEAGGVDVRDTQQLLVGVMHHDKLRLQHAVVHIPAVNGKDVLKHVWRTDEHQSGE